MTKGKWFLFSGLLILSSILIQLLKLIPKFDKDLVDGLSGAFLGMGIVFYLITFFKKKNK
jgi:hypothetical protein